MKTIRLGRSPQNNDKVYPQPYVSSYHATITDVGNGEYEVVDLGSTNGTYINGYRIAKARISVRDEVRLATDVIVDVPSLFGHSPKTSRSDAPYVKTNPKDFTREFAELKPIYEQYKSERRLIRKKFQQKMAIIRGAITLSPILALGVWMAITEKHLGFSVMGITILGSTIAGLFTSGITIEEQLEEMDENFRLRYVCPNEKCRLQLGTQMSWNLYHTTGVCPKYGAIYNKDKL